MASAIKAGAVHIKNTVSKSIAAPVASSHVLYPSSPLTHNKITLVRQVPAYSMAFSGNKWDRGDSGRNKSDASLFQKKDMTLFTPDSPNFDLMRLFIEFKLGDTANDPFDERTHVEEMNTAAKSRTKVREQILAYADRAFTYQHRTGFFSLIVIGAEFRFLRWDRSGVFVTEKKDYVGDPTTLVEFLIGFILLDDESQGIDPTAVRLRKDSKHWKMMDVLKDSPAALEKPVISSVPGTVLETDLAETILATDYEGKLYVDTRKFVWQHEYDMFVASVDDRWPRYSIEMRIGDNESNEYGTFLIGRPHYEMSGLIGRGTRGYIAYYVEEKCFVFLKDAWRPFYSGVDLEGNTLLELEDNDVPNVPRLVAHSFVNEQTTLVSEYWLRATKTNSERKRDKAKKERQAKEEADRRAREDEEAVAGPKKGKGKGKETANRRGVKRRRDDSREEQLETEQNDNHDPQRAAGVSRIRIRHFAHYRIVVREVCFSLDKFTSSHQLLSIVRDAMLGESASYISSFGPVLTPVVAHEGAVVRCQIIHRDVSSGNILICLILFI